MVPLSEKTKQGLNRDDIFTIDKLLEPRRVPKIVNLQNGAYEVNVKEVKAIITLPTGEKIEYTKLPGKGHEMNDYKEESS